MVPFASSNAECPPSPLCTPPGQLSDPRIDCVLSWHRAMFSSGCLFRKPLHDPAGLPLGPVASGSLQVWLAWMHLLGGVLLGGALGGLSLGMEAGLGAGWRGP